MTNNGYIDFNIYDATSGTGNLPNESQYDAKLVVVDIGSHNEFWISDSTDNPVP